MTNNQTISKERAENIDAADAEQCSESTAPEDGVTELKAAGYLTNYSLDRFVSQDLSRPLSATRLTLQVAFRKALTGSLISFSIRCSETR